MFIYVPNFPFTQSQTKKWTAPRKGSIHFLQLLQFKLSTIKGYMKKNKHIFNFKRIILYKLLSLYYPDNPQTFFFRSPSMQPDVSKRGNGHSLVAAH